MLLQSAPLEKLLKNHNEYWHHRNFQLSLPKGLWSFRDWEYYAPWYMVILVYQLNSTHIKGNHRALRSVYNFKEEPSQKLTPKGLRMLLRSPIWEILLKSTTFWNQCRNESYRSSIFWFHLYGYFQECYYQYFLIQLKTQNS